MSRSERINEVTASMKSSLNCTVNYIVSCRCGEVVTMKAVRVKKPGGIDELFVADAEKPTPGSHQVLIRVFASAVNRADILQVVSNAMMSVILTF